MPADTRQAKRPFQPSITSFFGRRDLETGSAEASPSRRYEYPELPATIQSSLLNVGMRIRKVVPEGYHLTKNTPRFEPRFSSRSAQAEPVDRNESSLQPTPTELTPYCGIMKVGGYAQQPIEENYPELPALDFHDGNDLGCPSSSQESNVSTLSTLSVNTIPSTFSSQAQATQKRPFVEEDDVWEEPDAFEDSHDIARHPSYPFSHTSMPTLNFMRPLAQPRGRNKHVPPLSAKQQDSKTSVVNIHTQSTDLTDFEEAQFLQPHAWAHGEMDMGDI
ncbi:MAG: hypothetical protein M1817_001088 [Caeruleum heppii]|nr:MAG: hypothetical protein M1817_001088 [Caeruleum heppii]